MEKLKMLVLVRKFDVQYPKHQAKYEFLNAVQEFADVRFWHIDGHIQRIIEQLNFSPDFILHYDIAANYLFSPKITGLNTVKIPVGAYVIDAHANPAGRMQYFEDNNIRLIFSATKYPFLRKFPKYKSKLRFLPFSINPSVIKDWQQQKTIDFLLMGLVLANAYPFRKAVLDKMQGVSGFVHHQHPGHLTPPKDGLMVNERYAMEINRSKIFFTCGSIHKYPVMKYFEVPGCRTLLLAESNADIVELGFRNGTNFVACNQSDFYDKAMFYLKNEEKREEITNSGYQFIHTYHTHQQRAKELVDYVTQFIDRTNRWIW